MNSLVSQLEPPRLGQFRRRQRGRRRRFSRLGAEAHGARAPLTAGYGARLRAELARGARGGRGGGRDAVGRAAEFGHVARGRHGGQAGRAGRGGRGGRGGHAEVSGGAQPLRRLPAHRKGGRVVRVGGGAAAARGRPRDRPRGEPARPLARPLRHTLEESCSRDPARRILRRPLGGRAAAAGELL